MAAKKLGFKTYNDYYTHYIQEIAPYIEIQTVQDVLAGYDKRINFWEKQEMVS